MGPYPEREGQRLARKEAALEILRILKPFSCADRYSIREEVESIYDLRERDTHQTTGPLEIRR